MMAHKRIAGRFNGFPQEAFEFFEQLAVHNNRDWFHAHQEVYERACRDPMKQLVAELGANPASTKISRINRDVRFSRDTLPYRTYIAAGVSGNYISLSPAGLYVGAGIYKPEPAALERFRSAIDNDESGRQLQRHCHLTAAKTLSGRHAREVDVRAARVCCRPSSHRTAPHERHLRWQDVPARGVAIHSESARSASGR